jgi:hypothetical protein
MTTMATETIKTVLDVADPNKISDALRKVKLGTLLTVLVEDTGVISPAATITLTKPALLVQSARVVSATTGNTVGTYHVGDASSTVVTPTAGANCGIAKISADGLTLTFATGDVTRAVIQYIPRPETALTTKFVNA